MKIFLFIRLVCTGFVSVFLMFFAIEANPAKYERFTSLVFAPGQWAARNIFSPGAQGTLSLKVEFAADFVFLWLVLLLILKLIDLIIFHKREIA